MSGGEEELLRMQQQALAHQQQEEEQLMRLQQQALQERQHEEMRHHHQQQQQHQQYMHHMHLPPPPPGMLYPPPPPPPHLMMMDGPPGDDGGPPPPLMSIPVQGQGHDHAQDEDDGVEGDMGEVRLPQALEQALAFKTERAKQVGVRPEEIDRVESEGLPSSLESTGDPQPPGTSPSAPTIARYEDAHTQATPGNEREKARAKRKQLKKRRRRRGRHQNKDSEDKDEPEKEAEKDKQQVEIEYVAEKVEDKDDPVYLQFARILEAFRLSEDSGPAQAEVAEKKEPDLRKVPKVLEEEEPEEEEEKTAEDENKPKLSKRKLKKLTRLSVAELKQLVNRPDVVEMHDVTARDPKLLVALKAYRNTVPVPRHWCFKRKYLQGKRGIEKPPFHLPDFIKRTGIMEMRAALQEKEEQKTLKAKMRERVRPKLGKIDIDYQKLHDAFFKWQTKPRMTIHGDLYYEGKEFETRLKEKKPGELTDELRTALGMPVGPNAHKVPPPWLIAMQRYGPPPSYPNLKVPGLNAPIPEGCSFGYHAGGWGKPPVDEMGKPLYGDVFGMAHGLDYNQPPPEEEVDRSLWGELESESEEEESEEEEDESEGDETEPQTPDEGGLVTPAEGLATPSGLASIPTGMETPEMIELRKRKAESEMEGGDTPALYTVLPERRVDRVGGMMMGSTHVYDMSAAQPGIKRMDVPSGAADTMAQAGGGGSGAGAGGGRERPGQVELALDPSELDLVDSELMHARYEQTIREQQNQLQKEDLSDMVAEHAAKQKNKRKRQAAQQENKTAKKYKEFKF